MDKTIQAIETLTLLEQYIAQVKMQLEATRAKQVAIESFLSQPNPKEIKHLATYFAQEHGLLLESHTSGKLSADYRLAKTIWNNYNTVQPFLQVLLQCVKAKRPAFLYPEEALPPIEQTEMPALLTFCNTLKQRAFLSAKKRGQRLEITLEKPDLMFLDGQWAEYVTRYLLDVTLKEITAERKLSYRLFSNLKFKRPGEEETAMELDVVAQIGDRFYIFETKSGVVPDVIKWVDRSRFFSPNIHSRSRYFMCTPRDEFNYRHFRPLHLLTFKQMKIELAKIIRRDFA